MLTKQIKNIREELNLDDPALSFQQKQKLETALDKLITILLIKFIEINLPEAMLLDFYNDLKIAEDLSETKEDSEKFFVRYLEMIPNMKIKLERYFEAHMAQIKKRLIKNLESN